MPNTGPAIPNDLDTEAVASPPATPMTRKRTALSRKSALVGCGPQSRRTDPPAFRPWSQVLRNSKNTRPQRAPNAGPYDAERVQWEMYEITLATRDQAPKKMAPQIRALIAPRLQAVGVIRAGIRRSCETGRRV